MASRDDVYFADALRISFDMSAWHLSSARTLCSGIEDAAATGAPNRELVLGLLAHVWGLVDTMHRIRELILQAPGLKKNTPTIQLFLRRTAVAEPLRHYIQHLRGDIRDLPKPSPPLWGAISWVSERDSNQCFTLLPGTAHPDSDLLSCAYDTWEGHFAQRFIITVAGQAVECDALAHAADAVRPEVIGWSNAQGCPDLPDSFALRSVRMHGFRAKT